MMLSTCMAIALGDSWFQEFKIRSVESMPESSEEDQPSKSFSDITVLNNS